MHSNCPGFPGLRRTRIKLSQPSFLRNSHSHLDGTFSFENNTQKTGRIDWRTFLQLSLHLCVGLVMGLGIYSLHPMHFFFKSLRLLCCYKDIIFCHLKKKCNSRYTSKKSLSMSPGHCGIFFFSFQDKIWKIAIHHTSRFNTPCHHFYGRSSTLIYLLFC